MIRYYHGINPKSTEESTKMSNAITYPNMSTVKEAAAQFGVTAAYIRTLCRTGKVRFVCAGNRWLVNMDSLAAYFNEGDDPAELESRHV